MTARDDLSLAGGLAQGWPAWGEWAAWAVEQTRAKGADSCDACAHVSRTLTVEISNSRLEHIQVHDQQVLSLRAFDARGAAGMAWLHAVPTRRDLARLVDQASGLLGSAQPLEGFTGLPEPGPRPCPQNLYDEQLAGLELHEVVRLADTQRLAVLQQAPQAVVSGSLAVWAGQTLLVNSLGLQLHLAETCFELTVDVTLPGEALSTYTEEEFGHELDRLAAASTAQQALAGARAYQNRQPGKALRTTVLLGPWATANLMDTLAEAASAEAIQRRRSWLTDRVSESIAGGGLTVIDDGLAAGGFHSCGFDGDGAERRATAILQAGRFQSPLHNLWTAGREGVANTGHGTRARQVEATNLRCLPGQQSTEQLLADVSEGIHLDDASWDVDPTTGEFACGLSYARRVAGGQITCGLDGLVWCGQILDVLEGIDAVSSGGRARPGLFWPTLRVREVQLSAGD